MLKIHRVRPLVSVLADKTELPEATANICLDDVWMAASRAFASASLDEDERLLALYLARLTLRCAFAEREGRVLRGVVEAQAELFTRSEKEDKDAMTDYTDRAKAKQQERLAVLAALGIRATEAAVMLGWVTLPPAEVDKAIRLLKRLKKLEE